MLSEKQEPGSHKQLLGAYLPPAPKRSPPWAMPLLGATQHGLCLGHICLPVQTPRGALQFHNYWRFGQDWGQTFIISNINNFKSRDNPLYATENWSDPLYATENWLFPYMPLVQICAPSHATTVSWPCVDR